MKDDHDHVSHCWHTWGGPLPGVPDDQVLQKCCECPETRVIPGAHA